MPDGPGGFRQGSSCPALLRVLLKLYSLRVQGYHLLWPAFPKPFHFRIFLYIAALQPRICRNKTGLGSSHFARHYSGNHSCFLFLWVMRCFSSPRLPPGYPGYPSLDGLPHSGICGSIRICRSPQLFAACHALLRLWEPRHPPYALSNFLLRILVLIRLN